LLTVTDGTHELTRSNTANATAVTCIDGTTAVNADVTVGPEFDQCPVSAVLKIAMGHSEQVSPHA
jgi:hypothetical protein